MDSNQRNILVDNLHKLSTEEVEEFLVVNGYFDPVDFPHNLAKVLLKYAYNPTITDTLYDLYISAILPSLVAVTNIQYTTEQIKNITDDNLTIFANILRLTHIKNKSTLKSRILRILSFAGIINTASEELPMDVIKIMGLHTPYYKLTNFCVATQACDIYFWMYKLTHDLGITNEEFEVMKMTQPDITTNVDTIRHQYFTIKTGCNNLALTKGSSEYIPFFLDSYLNIMDEIKAGNYLKAVEIMRVRHRDFEAFILTDDNVSVENYLNTILYYTILFLRHQHTINTYNVLPVDFSKLNIDVDFTDVGSIIHNEIKDYNTTYSNLTYSQYVYNKGNISSLVISSNIQNADIKDALFIAACVIGNKTIQDKLQIGYTDMQIAELKLLAECIRGGYVESYKDNDLGLSTDMVESYVPNLSKLSLILILLFGHMNLVDLYFIMSIDRYLLSLDVYLYHLVKFTLPNKIDDMIYIFERLENVGLMECFNMCVDMQCYEKIPYIIDKLLERYNTKEELESISDDIWNLVTDMFESRANLLANNDGTINIHVYRTLKAELHLLKKTQTGERIHSIYEDIRSNLKYHANKILASLF